MKILVFIIDIEEIFTLSRLEIRHFVSRQMSLTKIFRTIEQYNQGQLGNTTNDSGQYKQEFMFFIYNIF